MPEFRFRIPNHWKLSSHHISSIFVVGMDGIPWPCKIKLDREGDAATSGPIVHVARNRDESGHVYFVYPLRDHGEMLLCTGTLPVADEPYDLLKELARGTLNRLRNQLSIWEEGGLAVPETINAKVSEAIHQLAQTIMLDSADEQDRLATEAIESSVSAIFELSAVFTEQIAKFRREHSELGTFWLANSAGPCSTEPGDERTKTFDLTEVSHLRFPVTTDHDATLASLAEFGQRTIVGPWLDAGIGGIPESLLAANDHLERRQILLKECRQRLETLPEQAMLIHLVSGLNGIGHRHLSYPQQLQLTIDLLHLVDEAMIELPVMVSFDFPWAERLAGAVGGIHPLQIADSLLRQGVRISYLGLEINLDYWPNGSVIRDPFQWIDLIDVWAQLDLPLILVVRIPSGGQPVDPAMPVDRMVNHQRSNVTEQQRNDFLMTVLPMMVARPAVQGIIFPQWQDGDDPRFPYGGLVDDAGNKKPVFEVIERLRAVIDGVES